MAGKRGIALQLQVKSASGITLVPVETSLLAHRKIFIEGEIRQDTACAFVRKILILAGEDREKPIDILINSPGGEINAGMLMYDTIACSRYLRRLCRQFYNKALSSVYFHIP